MLALALALSLGGLVSDAPPPFSATSDTCNGQQIGPMSSCTVVIQYAPGAGTASSASSETYSAMWRTVS